MKKLDKIEFFLSLSFIEFSKDELEVFRAKNLVNNFSC